MVSKPCLSLIRTLREDLAAKDKVLEQREAAEVVSEGDCFNGGQCHC